VKKGYLSEYFAGVAAKHLSSVEADRTRSNQHEYQATSRMLAFMGRPSERTRLDARFLYLTDNEPEPLIHDAFLTLYDSRKGQPHRSPEYRFYFPSSPVSEKAFAGDLLVIAKMRNGGLLVIIAEAESSYCGQLQWLFGFSGLDAPGFLIKNDLESEDNRIAFTSRFILETIGVVVEPVSDSYLDVMLERFGGEFPKTRIFSEYARSTVDTGHLDPLADVDTILMTWMEREEMLFRTLEHHLVSVRLAEGFQRDVTGKLDVEGFISFSLSVQNRRKSRVGFALENHLELLFTLNGLHFDRGAITENRSKPDFIFPGIKEYLNPSCNPLQLTMLGVKSTCKDRWRQILSEAKRIDVKHLLTLESAISIHQTNEMQSQNVSLVIPRELHSTYTSKQQNWLMSVTDFRNLVKKKQYTQSSNS